MKYESTATFVPWVLSGALLLSVGGGAIMTLGDNERTERRLAVLVVDSTGPEPASQRQDQPTPRNGEEEVNNTPKTPEELLEMIRALKDSGLYFEGGVPESGPAAEAYSKLVYQRLTSGEGGVSGSLAAGNLRIYVVRAPNNWDYRTNEIDRYLDDFSGLEWIALFRDALEVPMGTETTRANPAVLSDERPYELRFQESIPDYVMLARMWNTFQDVIYEPKEIPRLRDECLRVSSITTNRQALMGLSKLVDACNEALKNQLGIYLSCD